MIRVAAASEATDLTISLREWVVPIAILLAAAISTIIASYAYFTKHINRAVTFHAQFGIEHSFRTAEQVALLRNELVHDSNRWLENSAANAREIALVRRDVE